MSDEYADLSQESLEILAIRFATEGDLFAFAEIADRIEQRISGIANRYCLNAEDPEDLTQGTILRIYENIGQWSGEEENANFYGWCRGVAVNYMNDRLRADKRKNNHELEAGKFRLSQFEGKSLLTEVLNKERQSLMRDALNWLEENHEVHYRAVWLYYYFSLNQYEVAERMECSQTTASKRLNRLCDAIANGIEPHFCHVAFWYVDRLKEKIFILASSGGYGDEYKNHRMLPLEDSAIGDVWREPAGSVQSLDLNSDRFLASSRMRRLAVKTILATKIQPSTRVEPRQGLGTLNAYFNREFFHRDEDAIQEVQNCLAPIATMVGDLTLSLEALRGKMAVSMLRDILAETPYLDDSGCDPIRDFYQSVFDADGVTLLGCPINEALYCVSTSGLGTTNIPDQASDEVIQPYREEPTNLLDPLYLLKDKVDENGQIVKADWGITRFACQPEYFGRVFRINDVFDEEERGLPDGFPPPLLKHVETFRPDCRERRRVLGMSLGHGETLRGFVRVVRAERSKPFTGCDERLFRQLGRLCETVFGDWQRAFAFRHQKAEIVQNDRRSTCRIWRDHFQRPVARQNACHPSLRELVKDLSWHLRRTGYNVEMVSTLLRHPGGESSDPFRVAAYHAFQEPSEKRVGQISESIRRSGREGVRLVKNGRIITLTNPETNQSSAWIPVTTWSESALVQTVVAIDLQEAVEWTAELVEVLFAVSSRVSAIWSSTQPIGESRDYVIGHDAPSTGTITFRNLETRIRGIYPEIDELQILLRDRDGWFPDEPPEDWTAVSVTAPELETEGSPALDDAAHLGVEVRDDGRQWSIPLFLGTERVGELHCTRLKNEQLAGLIGTIYSLWNGIALERDASGRYLYDRMCFVDAPLSGAGNDRGDCVVREWTTLLILNRSFTLPQIVCTRKTAIPYCE